MARHIKKPDGPFIPVSTTFSGGKERAIEFTLYPEYLQIRVVGQQGRFEVPYGAILRLGAEMEVKHRIKRGALSGVGA